MPGLCGAVRIGGAAILAAALSACSSLPERPPAPVSRAIADDGTTRLGRVAAAGRPATAALSGFRLLPTGETAWGARSTLARHAERSLDAQYYHVHLDTVGKRFLRDLRDAAARGVRVRLLVDDLYAGGLEAVFAGLAAHPGVEVRIFNPLPVRGTSVLARIVLSSREFGRINHRMHNKLLIADGALAVSGGRNIGDEYFMSGRDANFIDLDVVSSGPVVGELATVFDDFWNSRHVWPIGMLMPSAAADPAAARAAFDTATAGPDPDLPQPPRDPLGVTPLERQVAEGRLDQMFARARVVADPPEKVGAGQKTSAAMRSTLGVFGAAQAEVVIVSPYFIPGGPDAMPMIRAATGRGVRLVLITNALGATDEPLVYARYAAYRREMLALGVTIYELSPTRARDIGGFGDFSRSFARLHAKVAVVDRRHSVIGSMNLDGRSALANTELGLVIDSTELAERLFRLLGNDDRRSMYRLRLGANGGRIEWVARDAAGRETASAEEPDDDWLLRLKIWLLSPFAAEELL